MHTTCCTNYEAMLMTVCMLFPFFFSPFYHGMPAMSIQPSTPAATSVLFHEPITQKQRTQPLRDWIVTHRSHPYPTRDEKLALAMLTHMRVDQVTMWFANTRRQIRRIGMKAWSGGLYDTALPYRIGNGGKQEQNTLVFVCFWISSIYSLISILPINFMHGYLCMIYMYFEVSATVWFFCKNMSTVPFEIMALKVLVSAGYIHNTFGGLVNSVMNLILCTEYQCLIYCILFAFLLLQRSFLSPVARVMSAMRTRTPTRLTRRLTAPLKCLLTAADLWTESLLQYY